MKTLKILLQSDKSINEETPKKARAGKLLKSMLVIFILLWIILLYSCAVFVAAPGNAGPGVHRGHGEGRVHGERHVHGAHRGPG
jgi:uncharacterized membrane protein